MKTKNILLETILCFLSATYFFMIVLSPTVGYNIEKVGEKERNNRNFNLATRLATIIF